VLIVEEAVADFMNQVLSFSMALLILYFVFKPHLTPLRELLKGVKTSKELNEEIERQRMRID
jgi:hypothetical protein